MRETFEQHRGNEHLLDALQHQAVLVEALVKDLESQHECENIFELHHIHLIEEDLLHYENRIGEEIAILNQERHHEHHGAEELIRRGEELLRRAQDVVEQHRHHGDREMEAIEHEMHAVHRLIEEIRERPHGHDFTRDEESLKRHEDSLAKLLERVHHRHHHDEHHHDEHHHDEHHHHEHDHLVMASAETTEFAGIFFFYF